MMPRRTLSCGSVSSQDELHDFFMLTPHKRALLGVLEHDAHRAFEVRPLRCDRVLNGAVARQTVQRDVKSDVRLNEGQDRRIGTQL
jgi:hypothetical protein